MKNKQNTLAKVVKAPQPLPFLVFLAGSIENNSAKNWQNYVCQLLPDDIIVLNPRRDDWDSSWIQSINNPQFFEQVNWELTAMERADLIAMHFEPNTKSPITLLEFGLFAKSKKLVVHCPDGFWRKGNIDIVAAKYDIPMVDTLEDMIEYIKMRRNRSCNY